MSWTICFQPPEPRVCVDIPKLIREFEIPPDPELWIRSKFIDQKLAWDLSVLATIDLFASRLHNTALKKTVQSTIQSGVDQRMLKGFAKIEFS